MKSPSTLTFAAGVAMVAAALSASTALADDATATAREPGVWQKHQYSFAFMGFTTTYSCDGLADKLKLLLIGAGARKDAKASAGACASGFGRPDKFARANLTFYTLVPAATVGGAADQRADGIWRRVALAAHSPWELGIGDCELIEQFQTKVLPMFATRKVENRTTCIPYQESGSVINLKFESFAAAPKAT
jgi:hypothetical protein